MKIPALGIDVSKRTLEVALWKEDHFCAEASFVNSPKGYRRLERWIHQQGSDQVHALMEATGRYGEDLACYLVQRGQQVSVINPQCISSYAKSQLSRHKTDRVDAALIARYCAKESPRLWTMPSDSERTLREMVRGVAQLKRERQRLKNQLKQARHRAVQAALERSAAAIDREITQLEKAVERFLRDDAQLRRDRDLLLTIPGIGIKTIAVLLGELGSLLRFDHARALAAYVGLSVSHRESGTSIRARPHLSKRGNARVRQALYFPAMTALRSNPVIRALGARMESKGKEGKQIIGAAMRKLLHICYGVLKHGQPFDAKWHLSS